MNTKSNVSIASLLVCVDHLQNKNDAIALNSLYYRHTTVLRWYTLRLCAHVLCYYYFRTDLLQVVCALKSLFRHPFFRFPFRAHFLFFSAFLLLLMPHVLNLSQFTFSPSCFQRIATEANTSNPFLSMEIPGEFDWINTIQFTEHGYFLFSTNLHADFYLHQSHLELILYVGSSCRVSPLLNTSAKTFLSALYIIGDPLFYSSACYFCLFACVRNPFPLKFHSFIRTVFVFVFVCVSEVNIFDFAKCWWLSHFNVDFVVSHKNRIYVYGWLNGIVYTYHLLYMSFVCIMVHIFVLITFALFHLMMKMMICPPSFYSLYFYSFPHTKKNIHIKK